MSGKAKDNGHIPTEDDVWGGVSPGAELAIDALLGGASVTEAALAGGVARQTLSHWLHHNPIFQGALNRRREEVRTERMIGLSALIGDIETAVRDALSNPELPPAVIIQSGLGILPKFYAMLKMQSIGPDSSVEIARLASRKKTNYLDDVFAPVNIELMEDLLSRAVTEMQSA